MSASNAQHDDPRKAPTNAPPRVWVYVRCNEPAPATFEGQVAAAAALADENGYVVTTTATDDCGTATPRQHVAPVRGE
jgi:hypothetical protein